MKKFSSTKSPLPIARFIEQHAKASSCNYRDIAIAAGFSNSDIIYVFVRGEAKVPLDRVPALAGALECDAAHLFVLALQQFFEPKVFEELRELFMDDLTEDERGWLDLIRAVGDGVAPRLTEDRAFKVKAAFID